MARRRVAQSSMVPAHLTRHGPRALPRHCTALAADWHLRALVRTTCHCNEAAGMKKAAPIGGRPLQPAQAGFSLALRQRDPGIGQDPLEHRDAAGIVAGIAPGDRLRRGSLRSRAVEVAPTPGELRAILLIGHRRSRRHLRDGNLDTAVLRLAHAIASLDAQALLAKA